MKRQTARLTIGELARRAGLGLSTVRYYERAGLAPVPARSASNYRLYPDDAVIRLRFIRRAQQLGFTLEEIKGLLDLRVSRRTPCGEVRSRVQIKIADIDARIRSLRQMRRALTKLAHDCEAHRDGAGCPLLEYLEGQL
ncbi:MAG: heavy metal-responsive transcriptional regulator [Verrucomicrobiales bacterium]|nr:heavy metal-responsive transcriptional regulator [Verrucomicrobiales bacterium]